MGQTGGDDVAGPEMVASRRDIILKIIPYKWLIGRHYSKCIEAVLPFKKLSRAGFMSLLMYLFITVFCATVLRWVSDSSYREQASYRCGPTHYSPGRTEWEEDWWGKGGGHTSTSLFNRLWGKTHSLGQNTGNKKKFPFTFQVNGKMFIKWKWPHQLDRAWRAAFM